MVNFLEYVASEERKRRVSYRGQERKQRKRKGKKSFVSGTVKMPIGSNVAITKSRVLKHLSKNNSVLHKHVKWLKELEEERRRLQEKKEAKEKEKVERKRSFMERDAEKHIAGKTNNDKSESPSAHRDTLNKDPMPAISASNASSTAAPSSENKTTKPAWCQSETTREASEMAAETNLLSFVEGLDFDQYTQDLELRALMGQLKERIKILERENKKDQTKLQTCFDSENAAQRAEAVNIGPVIDDNVPTDVEQNDEVDADDTESIAISVMSESTVSSIHSKKSIKALVSKAKERILETPTIEEEDEEREEEKEKAVPPPVLSTVTDDNGARMAEKRSINKLAFKNRNPAL
ncbi:hypothetical protein ACHAW5_003164 [Stephanodiscus triporus]|uniref:Uncharacterized protein n=1 Tax=Stephanodiscus triporus TaxID=2934178 RepID=A0ABD3N354_9STRA